MTSLIKVTLTCALLIEATGDAAHLLPWRLSRNLIPSRYNLTITPILQDGEPLLGTDFTAPGHLSVVVFANSQSREIKMHSGNQTIIHGVKVMHQDTEKAIQVLNITLEHSHQFLILQLSEELTPGKNYRVWINFTSPLNKAATGLYRNSYHDPYTNTTKYFATTQMQVIHAREMFPCFDEPQFKAKFAITVGRREDRVALSCGHSIRNRTMDGVKGWVWEEFAETPIMPTYSLAIIVSEFAFVSAPAEIYPKKIRTFAPKHLVDLDGASYSVEKAARLLAFFENYYGLPYPMEKLDSVAVKDFPIGAMENYGLNVYSEPGLLYFPEESTEEERYRIMRNMAHEIGHQWFGNLVTPKWWTHIWISEGFATYMSAQGVDAISKEFQSLERFQNFAVQTAMSYDARGDYSHPLLIDEEAWVKRASMGWLDKIANEKGGAVVLMMMGFLSEVVMKEGLCSYLKEKEYQNVDQFDLFNSLDKVAKAHGKIPDDLSLHEIMKGWVENPGFPILRVDSVGDGLIITQERFINNESGLAKASPSQELSWIVPLSISTKSSPTPQIQWLRNASTTLPNIPSNSSWIVLNAGGNGYYRVVYSEKLTALMKQELDEDKEFLCQRTRSQLLDDYYNAAWQKYIGLEGALSLSEYLGKEDSYIVWNSVLFNLKKPFNILPWWGESVRKLKSFFLPKLGEALTLTGGLEQELPQRGGGIEVIRHSQFMAWLCKLEDLGCLNYSKNLVKKWMSLGNNTIRRDIKGIVYCAALSTGNDEIFTFLHNKYQESTGKEKSTILSSLACTKNITQINLLLEESVKDGSSFYSKAGDATTAIQQLARNPIARGEVLRFLEAKTEEIGYKVIPSIITSLATDMCEKKEGDQVETYLSKHPKLDGEAALKTIRENIAWAEYFGDAILAYFRA